MTVGVQGAVSPGLGQDGFGIAIDVSSDGVVAGSVLQRRLFPDIGADVEVHFYPSESVTPADIHAAQDWALDVGYFEFFVTVHPDDGLIGVGFGAGWDVNKSGRDLQWESTDLE